MKARGEMRSLLESPKKFGRSDIFLFILSWLGSAMVLAAFPAGMFSAIVVVENQILFQTDKNR
jgi:hypothetical protein